MKAGYSDFEATIVSMLTKKQKQKLLDMVRNINIGTEYDAQFGGILIGGWAEKIEESLTGETRTDWLEVILENRK